MTRVPVGESGEVGWDQDSRDPSLKVVNPWFGPLSPTLSSKTKQTNTNKVLHPPVLSPPDERRHRPTEKAVEVFSRPLNRRPVNVLHLPSTSR